MLSVLKMAATVYEREICFAVERRSKQVNLKRVDGSLKKRTRKIMFTFKTFWRL